MVIIETPPITPPTQVVNTVYGGGGGGGWSWSINNNTKGYYNVSFGGGGGGGGSVSLAIRCVEGDNARDDDTTPVADDWQHWTRP